jgi:hypothetical protein
VFASHVVEKEMLGRTLKWTGLNSIDEFKELINIFLFEFRLSINTNRNRIFRE